MIGDNARKNVVANYEKKTIRVIEPQYILLNWPILYALAWDKLRLSPRVFRIDRIQKARICGSIFHLRDKEIFTNSYVPLDQAI